MYERLKTHRLLQITDDKSQACTSSSGFCMFKKFNTYDIVQVQYVLLYGYFHYRITVWLSLYLNAGVFNT